MGFWNHFNWTCGQSNCLPGHRNEHESNLDSDEFGQLWVGPYWSWTKSPYVMRKIIGFVVSGFISIFLTIVAFPYRNIFTGMLFLFCFRLCWILTVACCFGVGSNRMQNQKYYSALESAVLPAAKQRCPQIWI